MRINLGTIVTAVLFTLAHVAQDQPLYRTVLYLIFGPLFALGLGIGYDRTRNLWGAVIVHNLANLINQGLSLLL